MATPEQINQWKIAIIDARTSHEWAYSQGPTRVRELALTDPALAVSVRRIAELHALIEEHSEM